MVRRNIVVIGASAGGVEALKESTNQLPADLPVVIFVVVPLPAQGTSVLPRILERDGQLPATHPTSGETFQSGRIYIALPNQHMQMEEIEVPVTIKAYGW